MANTKTIIEEWSVKDFEDNSALKVRVESCTELGNNAKPGIQVHFLANIVNFEPNTVEQWTYDARKAGAVEFLLEDKSWMVHENQYIKLYLMIGPPVKARVVVKTRSSAPIAKDYALPF